MAGAMKVKKGLVSLMEAYRRDVGKGSRPKSELDGKLRWVLERAGRYAARCGVTRDWVLRSWEEDRKGWWLRYYCESRFPEPEGGAGKVPVHTYEEWLQRGKELFGADMLHWKVRCPGCGRIQSLGQFEGMGIDPDYALANCMSRFVASGRWDCGLSRKGRIDKGGVYVIRKDLSVTRVFDFADEASGKNMAFQGGDIVMVRGLKTSSLNGKVGEVVDVLENGLVRVKVADLRLNTPTDVSTSVDVSPVPAEYLFRLTRSGESLARGGGVIYL